MVISTNIRSDLGVSWALFLQLCQQKRQRNRQNERDIGLNKAWSCSFLTKRIHSSSGFYFSRGSTDGHILTAAHLEFKYPLAKSSDTAGLPVRILLLGAS